MELLTLHEAAFPFLFVFLIGFVICLRLIGLNIAQSAGIAFLKAAIPSIYFMIFFDETWGILDDIQYYNRSSYLASLSYNALDPADFIQSLETVQKVAGSFQWFYYLWNVLAIRLFGDHYSSAVFLNVALTFVGGWSLGRLAGVTGFEKKYCKGLAIFFILHWDVLAWSSFVNIKDSVVVALQVTFFASIVSILLGNNISGNLCSVILTQLILIPTRVYATILSGVNWIISSSILNRKFKTLFLSLTISVVAGYVLATQFPTLFSQTEIQKTYSERPSDSILGFFLQATKFVIMPIPGMYTSGDEDPYGFAIPAYVLHHVFLPCFVISFLKLSYRNRLFLPIALFFVQVVAFYSIFPAYLGSRQRYQLCWIFAWCQFDFLYVYFHTRRQRQLRYRLGPLS